MVTIVELERLTKTFPSRTTPVRALDQVSFSVARGDVFGIIGSSGAGKSTLVRTINLLERPDEGVLRMRGADITAAPESELRRVRQSIGMIFQQFHLLNSKTVYENIAFPLRYFRKSRTEIEEKVSSLLELVGLEDKRKVYPAALSGGQKQRVAIARALVNDPDLLLSDESTSALDPQTTDSILQLLKSLNERFGLTIIFVTHEMHAVKALCNKVVVLDRGAVVEEGSVWDVFARPRGEVTKRLLAGVFKTDAIHGLLSHIDAQHLIVGWGVVVHLMFRGGNANSAYVSRISKEFDLEVSIIYGNIEIIQELPIGSLFIALTGDRTRGFHALEFLRQENISVEILKEYQENGSPNIIQTTNQKEVDS